MSKAVTQMAPLDPWQWSEFQDQDVLIKDVTAITQTNQALLCKIGTTKIWIPKNQIHELSAVKNPGDVGDLVITKWLARQKGMLCQIASTKIEKIEQDLFEVEDVEAVSETDRALRCIIGEDREWIPKSHIDQTSEVQKPGDCGTLVITEWIATQKGLR